jgi:hypothetical protein
MRSLGVPEGRRSRPVKARELDKKNRKFLAKPTETWYCFSESPASPGSDFW